MLTMRFRPTYRSIWGISFPIIIAGISETIVDITDTVFLAHYGITELAAIGVADAIYGLALFLTLGLVDGMQIVIGRRVGQERNAEVGAVFNQGLYLYGYDPRPSSASRGKYSRKRVEYQLRNGQKSL